MSTTINITLDTTNTYQVQAFMSQMSGVLMHLPFDHSMAVSEPIVTTSSDETLV